jgi:hypothetical protein
MAYSTYVAFAAQEAVADDEPAVRRVVARCVEALGYRAIHARHADDVALGIAVLAQAPGSPPDLHDGLRVSSPESVGLSPVLLARIADSVERVAPKTTSVLIARHGSLIYEAYFGDGSRDRRRQDRVGWGDARERARRPSAIRER